MGLILLWGRERDYFFCEEMLGLDGDEREENRKFGDTY